MRNLQRRAKQEPENSAFRGKLTPLQEIWSVFLLKPTLVTRILIIIGRIRQLRDCFELGHNPGNVTPACSLELHTR